MGRSEPMTGALLVLVTNVVFIVAASTATLWFQRAFRIRRNVAEPSPTRRV
jgi:hypothetical protein